MCLAAPVYLASKGKLRLPRLVVAILTMSILGAVLLMSLVPIPQGPSRYLPYIFAALLMVGIFLSGRDRGRRPSEISTTNATANPPA